MAADPGVQADTPGDGRHVDAELLAQVGHHVDERDLRGEKGVRRLLDQFGRRDAGHDDGAVEAPPVEVKQQRSGPLGIRTDDDSVRLEEITNRGALAQKLRIAGDIELVLTSAQASDRPVDPAGRAGGDRALLDD